MENPAPEIERRSIEASAIKGNIFGQLKAARGIFEIVPELISLAQERPHDRRLRVALEEISTRLLDVGGSLSANAGEGEKLLELPIKKS